MKAQFTFLSGARAGQIDVLSQSFIGIGRHPQCELRLDAEKDLDASSRHASVTLTGHLYILRDLGSTNGTLINGRRLTDDHVLADKDVIQLGPNGPKILFQLIGDSRKTPAPPPPAASGTALYPSNNPPRSAGAVASTPPRTKNGPPGSRSPPRSPPPGPGATTRIRAEVRRQTAHLRRTTIVLIGLLAVVTGAYVWQRAEGARRLEAQRRALLGQVDSLLTEIGALSTNVESMRGALDSAEATTARLRRQIEEGRQDPTELATLRRQLEAAQRQQRSLASAATLDAKGVTLANQDAVVLILVQFPSGRTYSSTGFVVSSDPFGGLVVTNRHVVTDSSGAAPSRIGVVFNGSNQNFRATLVRTHNNADLVLLRAEVSRGIPTVKGISRRVPPLAVGDAVAVLGYPLGVDLQMGGDWTKVGITATLTIGTVSRLVPNLVQLDSYGAEGSSGSPVFDRNGEVVGVIYGGEKSSAGRIVYAVPVLAVWELLGGVR